MKDASEGSFALHLNSSSLEMHYRCPGQTVLRGNANVLMLVACPIMESYFFNLGYVRDISNHIEATFIFLRENLTRFSSYYTPGLYVLNFVESGGEFVNLKSDATKKSVSLYFVFNVYLIIHHVNRGISKLSN